MEPLTSEHRRQQLALRALTVRQLRQVWPSLDFERLDESFPGWFTAVAAVVSANRAMSAALALRYLSAVRVMSGVAGAPPVPELAPLPGDVLRSSLAVTGPVAVKKAMARGDSRDRALTSAFVLSSLSATRHVLDAGRQALTASLARDGRAEGWRRVTSPRACEFCDSLEDIYPPGYGDFKSHDGCACTVEPVYR